MRWSATCVLVAVTFYGGLEVETSGIDKFLKDDYQDLKQMYGKTSDKDIYGEILPASVIHTGDKKKSASEKRERILFKYNDPDSHEYDSSNFGEYKTEFSKETSQLPVRKPATSTMKFITYHNAKPTSQANDPETYKFFKHFEGFSKEEGNNHPKSIRGSKPYYGMTNGKETDAFKNIQDILDAHEKNKRNSYKKEENKVKHFNNFKNKKKPPKSYNKFSKPRCIGGRCRHKVVGYRSRKRPYRRVPAVKTVVVM